MPIPTDTFWNIKRLNIVFALSAVALVAVTGWAILQDHNKDWRVPQQQARVWDLALTEDKIQRQLTPEERATLAKLTTDIGATEQQLDTQNKVYADLLAERKKVDSDRATLEFRLGNLKSNVQVSEALLQDAITEGDKAKIASITADLQEPRKQLFEMTEKVAALVERSAEIRSKVDAQSAQLDQLKKDRTKLASDVESLNKKANSLDPARQGGVNGILGKISQPLRDAPLLDFLNPSEKPASLYLNDVQTDVAFMKITTVDRCTTCHVNIGNKDFTEEKVLAYLEEQTATVRKLNLPEVAGTGATAPAATASKPGPTAAAEFWHGWARRLSPTAISRNAAIIGAIGRSTAANGPATVTYDGKPIVGFTYAPAATDPQIITQQNDILVALIGAMLRWSPGADGTAVQGKASVVVSKAATGAALTTARNQSLRYPELLRNALKTSLSPEQWEQLEERYRYFMVDEVNVERHNQHLKPLDGSAVLLAHPNLELFVDVDSPHSMEAVGCTSCHDGSGQETDFVLAAHTARDMMVDAKTGVPVLSQQLSTQAASNAEPHDLSNMLAAVYPPDVTIPKGVADIHIENPPATQPSEAAAEGEHGPADYIDPANGNTGKAITQFEYWKKIYEPKAPRDFALVYHEWDWPMRKPEYMEVNCARCHTEVYDIKESAPTLYHGRQLFTQLGCVNCHQMDSIPSSQNRRVGTDLRHITAKLSPAYVNTWVWAPKAFRPTTKMPHFFMLENNSSEEEIRRTRQEARAITEYLTRTATPLEPAHVWPQTGAGNAATGKELFATLGCMACHQNLNEHGEEWITTDLVKRAGMTADAAKTSYDAMSYNERQLYVQQNLSEPTTVNAAPKYADGSPKPSFVQVGPELSGIGTKLTAGRTVEQARQWLFDWLEEPRHYSDYTFMPRLRLSEQQAMDLAEYLLGQKRTTNDPKDPWKAELTPADSAKLIELTALQLKSRYSVTTAKAKADDKTELTALATAALTTPVTTRDVAASEVAKMSLDEMRLVFLGQKMIANYGCMSCHAINGMESVSSPCANLSDWGQKSVDKLDFGYLDHHKRSLLPEIASVPMVNGLSAAAANLAHGELPPNVAAPVEVAWPEVEHLRQSWIHQKLLNSRAFDRGKALLNPSDESVGSPYDKLKMPTFYLNEEQVHAIITFVLSNKPRLISERLTSKAVTQQAQLIARGRELTERYNCIACHQTEKNVPQIQQYFKVEDIPTKAPPSLRGEGNKIQFSWLFNFFKNVEPMRPLIFTGIRMPSFPATDDDWTAIIAYFNSISNKESVQLAKYVDPVQKYVATKRAAATQPSQLDPANELPGDDWWKRPEFANASEKLKQWALDYGHIKPIEVAASATPDDLRGVYRNVLFKASFTRELYAAPYPFVDSPRPLISDERFAQGEKFFYEMQCLKCHVLGDPSIAGANKTPTAPNLGLAFRRLQQRWVRHWIQEPNIIQVGTAMPPFFTGIAVNKLDGQTWPKSQGGAEADVHRIEGTYGATVQDQTALLLDFIYSAGVRGHTGVQPPTSAPAAASAGP